MSVVSTHVLHRPGSGLSVEELSVTEPPPGHVAVEVRATGVCHSDLHIINGDWPTDQPLVMGHEASGVIQALGANVEGLSIGDHVVLSWFAPCRRCQNCAAGRAWLCTGTTALANTLPDGSTPFTDAEHAPVWPYLGLGTWGSMVVVPEAAAIRIHVDVPFEVGALLGCSVTTGVGAVLNTARVEAGSAAVVVGCGGVGLSIIMGLHLAGATTIIAADLSETKLAQARAFGATHTVNSGQDDLSDVVGSLGGADYVFEAIGNPRVMEALPALLRPGGAMVLAGMTAAGSSVAVDPFDLADQGKSILGCNYGSSVPGVDIPRLAELYLRGRLPVQELIGSVRPLEQAADAVEQLAQGVGLRTILVPGL